MMEDYTHHQRKIAVIGLGYVGLPVAIAFARKGSDIVGFDIDESRISELRDGHDRTNEFGSEELKLQNLKLTSDQNDLKSSDFFIVTVPTPIDAANRPDLSAVFKASKTIGGALKKGDIVVYESTVYPGATEEDCGPILESVSGLKCGSDFFLGYSPERINPGDRDHRFENITKVVAAQTPASLEIVANVYGSVVKAGTHRAPSIKVAEAAKVIENTQRDLNIAFMNELSLIFQRLDIDTGDVLAAARTKWNFLPFTPGLVGGHCIGVDPYYLTHRAERAGYHPEVILAGRRVNDSVGSRIARECVKLLLTKNVSAPRRVTILGLTFKEDVPDIRNSKVFDIAQELKQFGIFPDISDPLADAKECELHGIKLTPLDRIGVADALIIAVSHREWRQKGWDLILDHVKSNGIVMDIKGILDRTLTPPGVTLWRL